MDWFNAWEPVPYIEVEPVDLPADGGRLLIWLIVATIALAAALVWYERRVARHSIWCATAGRDVEMGFRRGRALSCSAFEDPAAIACGRRCLDRSFRVQWPSALPVLAQRGGPAALI
jgi:hypothetical protein